jgi:hypothetical protein
MMKNFKLFFEMKNKIFPAIAVLFFSVILIATSCSEKQREYGYTIPKSKAAQALTIGWYVPVNLLQEIVGPQFEPAVVKDEDNGTIAIYIVSGTDHTIDSLDCGILKAAYLFVPVKKPDNMKIDGASSITNTLVCPLNIVEQSPVLGNKFHEFGFPTYTGKIYLDVTWSGEKYHVKASIETVNGLIEIAAMFEEEPSQSEMVSAIFNPKSTSFTYFHGEERFQRIINGKGNLKTDGENMIKAMNLSGQPYYLKLDFDVSWNFDFVKE